MTVDISRFMNDGVGLRNFPVKQILLNQTGTLDNTVVRNNCLCFTSYFVNDLNPVNVDNAGSTQASAYISLDGTEIIGNATMHIVEFYPGVIKKKEYCEFLITESGTGNMTANYTLTNTFDTNKSMAYATNVNIDGQNGFAGGGQTRIQFIDSNTIQGICGIVRSGYTVNVKAEVIEFY